jgi:hypothetical protein
VFVPKKYFQTSLTFVSKDEAYPSGAPRPQKSGPGRKEKTTNKHSSLFYHTVREREKIIHNDDNFSQCLKNYLAQTN